jgi:hypothetical protein
MSQETKELRVGGNDNAKRVMYLIKEFLVNRDSIEVVSGTQGAPTVTRAAEALVRLKYVTYSDIRTETNIMDGKRRTRLVVTLTKTNQFAQLYDENEANKKKFLEEKTQKTSTTK